MTVEADRGGSRSRWKPTSFSYPQFLFLWLLNRTLVNPDYGIPARIDILLGGNIFSKTVLHGWPFSPTGAPSASNTCFGWVQNGMVKGKGQQSLTHICGVSLNNHSRGIYK